MQFLRRICSGFCKSFNSRSSVLFEFRNRSSFARLFFLSSFFSLFMISSDSFNVMIYIIIFFLYFEFSNLGEEIVKWFASNNIISIKHIRFLLSSFQSFISITFSEFFINIHIFPTINSNTYFSLMNTPFSI